MNELQSISVLSPGRLPMPRKSGEMTTRSLNSTEDGKHIGKLEASHLRRKEANKTVNRSPVGCKLMKLTPKITDQVRNFSPQLKKYMDNEGNRTFNNGWSNSK